MNAIATVLRQRILDMVAHATIEGYERRLPDWETLIGQVHEHPRVVGAAPYVEQETLIRGRATAGAQVRGIDPDLEPEVSEIGQLMHRDDQIGRASGRDRKSVVQGKRVEHAE